MKKVFKAFLILGLLISTAQADERRLIATTAINDIRDRDRVDLPTCQGPKNEKTTHLKLKVNRHRVEVYNLEVTFENGETQELYVRKRFRRGSTSEWLELVGGPRCVRRIKITADANIIGWNLRKKALISFYAKKDLN